ncbi:MAG: SEC-C metal-binding domain-containing protein [Polyangiaceae bacterium]
MRTRDTSEAGLIELAGDAPMWIWAFTCPTPGCDCRTAVVLSTGGDRRELIARGAPVREAWLRGESHSRAAAALDGVVAFAVDIDEGVVFPAYDENPFAVLDFVAHPEAREVVDRIDGEILETIGRLWYAGKGWSDPEEKRREAERIELPDWKRGDLVAWDEALVGVRQDMFRLGDRVFEAVDLYCVAPGCSCGEAVLEFAPIAPRGMPPPGAVRIDKSGQCTLEPTQERHGERLQELWAAFQKRHPRYRERFARRAAVMQGLAGRIVGAPSTGIERRSAKVGRNDPCPCGSGRKYKKCCGAS